MIISCKGGDAMFITLEGIDGCGKSTQARMLYDALRVRWDAVLTKEPGGWRGGEMLREMVIGGSLQHPWSEVFLFMLDRAEHAARLLTPALTQGRHVVCERYQDSTIAYQAFGRGLPLEAIRKMAELAAFPVPDVTVLFDAAPEIALSRVSRRSKPDAFESEGLAFMSKVREGYRSLAAADPERWVVIECGGRAPDDIFAELKRALTERGLSL